MITIIHGDNISASRKYFIEQKEKYPEIQILDGEKITLTDLVQVFDGGGFFGEQKNVFIENFFSRKKSKSEFSFLTEYLQKQNSYTIYIWEGKELDKSSLMIFKAAAPKVFKLPQALFLFLDSIKPRNGKQLISLFHQTLETTDVEMVFFMLVRQTRMLLAVFNPAKEQIDEIKRLAPWQMSKLKNQASQFSPEELIGLRNKLFQLELAQKTGNLSSTLSSSIDFLLLEI